MESVIEPALAGRGALLLKRQRIKAELPLRFWRQQVHFTTPATGRPERAIAGLQPVSRLLARHHISLSAISERSGANLTVLQQLLSNLPASPLVMVDAEDAVADTEQAQIQAREGAVRCFQVADWGQTLRFFRPAGLGLASCVEDLTTVLGALVDQNIGVGRQSNTLLLDGIIWPKVEDAEEMRWLCDLLTSLEQQLRLPANAVRLQFLVESATALEQLDRIVEVARPRLCGIIWGAADYAADVGLHHWKNDHPLFDWARAIIINSAGAAGVPAIDAMTFNYPTPVYRGDNLDDQQRAINRDKILSALAEVYDDALHGRELGMSGKWVGHPAQLLMVQAAYLEQGGDEEIQRALDALTSYRASVNLGLGATIIGQGSDTQMADRATDRHLRSQLRRSAALGLLAPDIAHANGLISEHERAELMLMRNPTS